MSWLNSAITLNNNVINSSDPLGLKESDLPKKLEKTERVPVLFPRAGPSSSYDGCSIKEPEKRKGLTGQPVHILTRKWRDDLDRYDQEMQNIETERFGNADIKENGINRKIISTEDKDLINDLTRITTCQPFTPAFCRALFSDIHIAFMGDSLARGLYKDLIVLMHTTGGGLSPDDFIKKRLEPTWYDDRLLDFADPDEKTEYMEFREYLKDEHWIQYVFTTRIYNDKVEHLLAQFKQNPPDVVVIHSNIWDSTRYASDDRISLTQFALRLSYLCQRLKEILEPTALVIFVLLPPAAYEQATDRAVKKGFFSYFIEQRMTEMNRMTGFISSAINYFAAQIMSSYGFDILDLNYHFQQDTFCALRAHDGLHYTSLGVRIMNQTLIGHIIKAWDVDLPKDISERLEIIQVEYFENHVDELENSENANEGDFMSNLPDCYRNLFQMSKEVYKDFDAENSPIPRIIKEYRGKLLRSMKDFVRDPYMKRYVIDLKSLAKARPADRAKKEAALSGPGPITSKSLKKAIEEELQKTVKMPIDDDDETASIASGASPPRDPELNNQFDELTDEDKEFLSKTHLSDALWMELWRGYFDFAARTLGLAPDESEEAEIDSDLASISDDEEPENMGVETEPIPETEFPETAKLPPVVGQILTKLFD